MTRARAAEAAVSTVLAAAWEAAVDEVWGNSERLTEAVAAACECDAKLAAAVAGDDYATLVKAVGDSAPLRDGLRALVNREMARRIFAPRGALGR